MTDPSPDDAAVLPQPTLPEPARPDAPAIPTLPAATPPTPPAHTEEELFDAKAMVEATTAHVANPAYGGLPAASEEGLEAQRKLRAKARKKRQRNRLIAWGVVAIFIGGIVGAGWFAYQAYQDDQDQQAAERAAAEAAGDDDTAGVVPGALTPLGNQQQVLDAMDDLNSSDAQLSGGGLRDIVDQARDVVGQTNDADGSPSATAVINPPRVLVGDQLPDPISAIRPDYRTIGFDVRYYDSSASGAAFTHYSHTYDTERDDYYASVKRPSDQTGSLVVFFEAWRHTVEADGSVTRVPRSAGSLDPQLDTPLAALVSELQVLSVAAREHAVLTARDEIDPATAFGFDGTALIAYGFQLDVSAFAATSPAAHEEWLAFWTSGRIDDDRLIDPGVRQRRTEDIPAEFLSEFDPIDFDTLETAEAPDGLAAIVYLVTENGLVQQAMIASPLDDVRVIYSVAEINDDTSALQVGGEWVDAS